MDQPTISSTHAGFLLAIAGAKQEVNVFDKFNQMLDINPVVSLGIGIFLTILGSCLMAVGNIVMKLGIQYESQRLRTLVSYPLCSKTWWAGMSCYCFGATLHVLALAFAPATVLAPMNSLGLVANAIAAATFLEENFGLIEGIGTLGTMLGVALCAFSALIPQTEPSRTVTGLDCWRDPWYLTFVGLCAVLAITVLIYLNIEEFKYNQTQLETEYDRFLSESYVEMTPIAKAEAEASTREATGDTWRKPPPRNLIGILYGFMSGLVGAQFVLEVKEFVACVRTAADSNLVWWQPQPYLVFISLVASVVLQMHFLNFGLARGDATIVIPTYYVSWTLTSTAGGFAKFREMCGSGIIQYVIFFTGMLVVLLCIGFMAVQEMIHVRQEADRFIPELSLELGQEVVEEQQRQLLMGIPIAFGFMVIPIGRLAGRADFEFRKPNYIRYSGARRTQSDVGMEQPSRNSQPLAGARGGNAAYNWTLATEKLPSTMHESYYRLKNQSPTNKQKRSQSLLKTEPPPSP